MKSLTELAGQFEIVYMDPPWPYYGDPNKNAAAGKHYTLMTMEDLKDLPVKQLFKKHGALFMWATCPRLDLAFELGKAYDLFYRGVAFNWVKTRKDGKPIGAQGIPPTATKPTTELCLLFTTCKVGRPFPLLSAAVSQYVETDTDDAAEVVYAQRTGKHSEKPKEVRTRIAELYGHRSRIELFARDAEPGWQVWGNQAPEAVL